MAIPCGSTLKKRLFFCYNSPPCFDTNTFLFVPEVIKGRPFGDNGQDIILPNDFKYFLTGSMKRLPA
jgi:hypothetical protein